MASLTGKKVLLVIAHEGFRDEEYAEPRKILEAAGAEVTVASTALTPAKGMLGATAQPDILLSDARAEDYDAVVFVGGAGASCYWDDPKAHALAREMANAGKPVGAICIAPVTLANAGLLEGKKCTVFASVADRLRTKGGNVTGAPVERDGNIITADGPTAAAAFGQAIVEALSGR